MPVAKFASLCLHGTGAPPSPTGAKTDLQSGPHPGYYLTIGCSMIDSDLQLLVAPMSNPCVIFHLAKAGIEAYTTLVLAL